MLLGMSATCAMAQQRNVPLVAGLQHVLICADMLR